MSATASIYTISIHITNPVAEQFLQIHITTSWNISNSFNIFPVAEQFLQRWYITVLRKIDNLPPLAWHSVRFCDILRNSRLNTGLTTDREPQSRKYNSVRRTSYTTPSYLDRARRHAHVTTCTPSHSYQLLPTGRKTVRYLLLSNNGREVTSKTGDKVFPAKISKHNITHKNQRYRPNHGVRRRRPTEAFRGNYAHNITPAERYFPRLSIYAYTIFLLRPHPFWWSSTGGARCSVSWLQDNMQ